MSRALPELDDDALVRLTVAPPRPLVPATVRAEVLVPLLVFFAVFPGLYALSYRDLTDHGALWALRALEYSGVEGALSGAQLEAEHDVDDVAQAPPVTAWLAAWSLAVFGRDSSLALVLPAYLFGVGIVVLVYVAGREWFSSSVGLVAGILLACSLPLLSEMQQPVPGTAGVFFALLSLWGAWRQSHDEQRARIRRNRARASQNANEGRVAPAPGGPRRWLTQAASALRASFSAWTLVNGGALGLCLLAVGPAGLFVLAVQLLWWMQRRLRLLGRFTTPARASPTAARPAAERREHPTSPPDGAAAGWPGHSETAPRRPADEEAATPPQQHAAQQAVGFSYRTAVTVPLAGLVGAWLVGLAIAAAWYVPAGIDHGRRVWSATAASGRDAAWALPLALIELMPATCVLAVYGFARTLRRSWVLGRRQADAGPVLVLSWALLAALAIVVWPGAGGHAALFLRVPLTLLAALMICRIADRRVPHWVVWALAVLTFAAALWWLWPSVQRSTRAVVGLASEPSDTSAAWLHVHLFLDAVVFLGVLAWLGYRWASHDDRRQRAALGIFLGVVVAGACVSGPWQVRQADEDGRQLQSLRRELATRDLRPTRVSLVSAAPPPAELWFGLRSIWPEAPAASYRSWSEALAAAATRQSPRGRERHAPPEPADLPGTAAAGRPEHVIFVWGLVEDARPASDREAALPHGMPSPVLYRGRELAAFLAGPAAPPAGPPASQRSPPP